jgi:hypothetical protein
MAGIGNSVQRTGDGEVQVGYSVVERSGGRVTSCAVYTVHVETRSAGLKTKDEFLG